MDWSNERYVRLYVRNTITWHRLEFAGQTVFMHVLRRLDRAGVLDLSGIDPEKAIGIVTSVPVDIIRDGLRSCLDLGVLVVDGDRLLGPNYIDAQEAVASNAERQRRHRARLRAEKNLSGSEGTGGNALSRAVTRGNESNPTPSVLNQPNQPNQLRVGGDESLQEETIEGNLGEWREGELNWLKVFGCWCEYTICFDEPYHHRESCESILRSSKRVNGKEPRRIMERAIKACAENDWVKANRPTPAYLAKNFTKYAAGLVRSKEDDDYKDLARKARERKDAYEYAKRIDESGDKLTKLKASQESAEKTRDSYLEGTI